MALPEITVDTTVTLREAKCIVTALGFLLSEQEGLLSGEQLTRFEMVKVQYQLILRELRKREREQHYG